MKISVEKEVTLTFTKREVLFLLNALAEPIRFEDRGGEAYFKNTRINLLKHLERAYLGD